MVRQRHPGDLGRFAGTLPASQFQRTGRTSSRTGGLEQPAETGAATDQRGEGGHYAGRVV